MSYIVSCFSIRLSCFAKLVPILFSTQSRSLTALFFPDFRKNGLCRSLFCCLGEDKWGQGKGWIGLGFHLRASVVWILPSRVPKMIACKAISVSCSILDLVTTFNNSRCLFRYLKYYELVSASFFRGSTGIGIRRSTSCHVINPCGSLGRQHFIL